MKRKSPILNLIREYWHLSAAGIIGIAAFLLIYGLEPLRFTNVSWMMYGFQAHDIVHHQSGWMFFRYSPWTFPLGKALYLGYPGGTAVSFTDSIPIAAIFFKLFTPFMTKNFQYLGLWVCLCFALQGIFSAALIFHFTKNRPYSLVGSVLFLFSTIFLERCFHHTALASHWLLLAGLLLYLKGKQKSANARLLVIWGLLLCLAEGIHPYLFIMVSGVFCLYRLELLLKGPNRLRTILTTALAFVIAFAFGYCIGLYGNSVSASVGFGELNMNLNSLFNPKGYNYTDWSLFLPSLPIAAERADGILYLGLPALILLAALLIHAIVTRQPLSEEVTPWLLILMVLYTLYAISNVVAFGDHVLLKVPLPEPILKLCNIFRSSNRFFFLPFYCLLLFIVVRLYRICSRRQSLAIFACALFAALQIIDISPALKEFHDYYSQHYEPWQFTEEWDELAENYDTAIAFDLSLHRIILYWLGENGFKTNANISAPQQQEAYRSETASERERLREALADGSEPLAPNTIYIIPDQTGPELTFKDEASLEEYLDRVQNAYTGKAELRHMEDFARSYWILCPAK